MFSQLRDKYFDNLTSVSTSVSAPAPISAWITFRKLIILLRILENCNKDSSFYLLRRFHRILDGVLGNKKKNISYSKRQKNV